MIVTGAALSLSNNLLRPGAEPEDTAATPTRHPAPTLADGTAEPAPDTGALLVSD